MDVITRDGWLSGNTKTTELVPGETLGELAGRVFQDWSLPYLMVQVNSEPLKEWRDCIPKEDDHVVVYFMPQGSDDGGKNVLQAVASIAIAVVAPQISGLWLRAAFVVGANLVVNAIAQSMIKPPYQDSEEYKTNPFNMFSIQQNVVDPFGPVARIYGKVRHFPKLIAQPYPEVGDDLQDYQIMLFDFGYGPLRLTNFQIGEQPLGDLDAEITQYTRFNRDSKLKYFSNNVIPIPVNVDLTSSWIVQTTEQDTEKAVLDIYFPAGLYSLDKNSGKRNYKSVKYEVEAKLRGAPDSDYVAIRKLADISVGAVPNAAYDNLEELYGYPIKPIDTAGHEPGSNNPYKVSISSENWTNGVYYPFDEGETIDDRIVYYGIKGGATTVQFYPKGSDTSLIGRRVYFNPLHVGLLPDFEPVSGVVVYQDIQYFTVPQIIGGKLVSRTTRIYGKCSVLLDNPITDADLITTENKGAYIPSDNIYIPGTYGESEGFGNIVVTVSFFPTRDSYDGEIYLNGETYSPFLSPLNVNFLQPGQYTIRVRRLSSSPGQYEASAMRWQRMTSHIPLSGATFRPIVDHTVVELRIRATDQLGGTINNFNAVAESILQIPDEITEDGVTYIENATRNPAWIYLDILRGSATKHPVAENNIDFDELQAWADECNEPAPNDTLKPRFQCDLVIGGSTTVKEALQTVAATGRAAPSRKDNKLSIVRRKPLEAPAQLITQKNCSSFSASMVFIRAPDAIRCSYNDATLGYVANEVIVFNDGFDESNAVVYEQLDLPGTTERTQAQRLGRYFLAAGILERERINCTMDIENLVAQRGDKVKVAHDVLKAGGLPRRIIAIDGNVVTFDESLTGAPNAIRRRDSNQGFIIAGTLIADNQMEFASVFKLYVGDLVEYGVTETIYAPFVVEQVLPGKDFSADLQLIEFRESVDDAVDAPIPDRDMRIGANQNAVIGPVQGLILSLFTYRDNGQSYADYLISWVRPVSGHVDYYNVKISISGSPLTFAARTESTSHRLQKINLSKMTNSTPIVIGVEPVIDLIGKGPIALLNDVINPDTTPPPDVEKLECNAQTEQLLLLWDLEDRSDVSHFEVRSHNTPGTSWENAAVVIENIPGLSSTVTVPLETGEYQIKAIDAAGNYSVNSAKTIVQVDELENVQLYDSIDFDPFASGTYEHTEVTGSDSLILDGTDFVGWYYPDSVTEGLHFPSATKVRLAASMGSAITSIDSELEDTFFQPLINAVPLQPSYVLANNPTMANIYFRYTNGGTIADSPWTKLIVADVTATDIEFAIKLSTTDARYSPSLFAAQVRADYNERTERGSVSIASAITESVSFAYGFAEAPMVAITLENATAGDSFTISNLTSTGFDVTIYDKDQNVKAGQLDWSALGFGKVF